MMKAVRLWQLISPSLPVGAYSYSQGLEQAVHTGHVHDDASTLEWIRGVLRAGIGSTDLPVLARVYAAAATGDDLTIRRWSDELVARRETAELRFEDLSMGGALARLLRDLGVRCPACELTFAAAFAIAGAHWRIPLAGTAAGYAWAWCEAQTAAAVKLVPLGHTAGQRVLLALGGHIDEVIGEALLAGDDDIGASLPGLALVSALHETQYTRLFRS